MPGLVARCERFRKSALPARCSLMCATKPQQTNKTERSNPMDITAIKEQLDQADKTRAALAELLGHDQPLNQTFNIEGNLGSLQDPEHPLGGQTVICRTYTSGVSIGTLSAYSTSSAGYEIHLTDAIRLWQWKGAFTLSEVATTGPTSARCDKHPEAGVWMADRGIELLPMTDVALAKLHEVATWGAK